LKTPRFSSLWDIQSVAKIAARVTPAVALPIQVALPNDDAFTTQHAFRSASKMYMIGS
jgi:hypothetical protein